MAAGGIDVGRPDLRAALRPAHRRRAGRPAGRADHRRLRPASRSGVTGPGGHTARPHLTADLVYALGKIVTELPGPLSRRVDPRAACAWSGARSTPARAANAIPDEGLVAGTVRCLDDEAWARRHRT